MAGGRTEPLRLFLLANEEDEAPVAAVLPAEADLDELLRLARHAFGLPKRPPAEGCDCARLYLPDGSTVQFEDLFDNDHVTVAFEGEPFHGALEGSAWSLASLVLHRPSDKGTVAIDMGGDGAQAVLLAKDPMASIILEEGSKVPTRDRGGFLPQSNESQSVSLLDPSQPRSNSDARGAAHSSPKYVMETFQGAISEMPPQTRRRLGIMLATSAACGCFVGLAISIGQCGATGGAHDVMNGFNSSALPLGKRAQNQCTASTRLGAIICGFTVGLILGGLGGIGLHYRAKLLSKLLVDLDKHIHGVAVRDWLRITMWIPMCTILFGVIGAVASGAASDASPSFAHALSVEAHDGELETTAGDTDGWTQRPMQVGWTWGSRFGVALGLLISLVFLLDVLRSRPDVSYEGALERTRLRRRIRSCMSPFEGRNGITLINTIAASAIGIVVIYFVGMATSTTLETLRYKELAPCPIHSDALSADETVPFHCNFLRERCMLPPLWMRPTLFDVVNDGVALQPFPSPASSHTYSNAISGTSRGEVLLSLERLLSYSEGDRDVRVCWREGASPFQLMPDLLFIHLHGLKTTGEARVAVTGHQSMLSVWAWSSGTEASEPPRRIAYDAFGSLSLLVALDVQPNGSPADVGSPLLPGTVAANISGAEACDGHFELSRAHIHDQSLREEMDDAELADTMDKAARAAVSRITASLCFGTSRDVAGLVGVASKNFSAPGFANLPVSTQPLHRGLAHDIPLLLSAHVPRLRREAARQVGIVLAVATAGLLVFGVAMSVILCMLCCGNVAAGAHAVGCCCVKVEGHFDGKASGCCCVSFLPPRVRSIDVQRPYDRFFGGGSLKGYDEPGNNNQLFWQSEPQEPKGFLNGALAQARGLMNKFSAPFQALRNLAVNLAPR